MLYCFIMCRIKIKFSYLILFLNKALGFLKRNVRHNKHSSDQSLSTLVQFGTITQSILYPKLRWSKGSPSKLNTNIIDIYIFLNVVLIIVLKFIITFSYFIYIVLKLKNKYSFFFFFFIFNPLCRRTIRLSVCKTGAPFIYSARIPSTIRIFFCAHIYSEVIPTHT